MLKFAPIILAVLYALAMFRFSAWRLHRDLDNRSTPLTDPLISTLCKQMADCLDIDKIQAHIFEVDPINGLAAPDGRIFITRGFFNKYKRGEVSADEIASVIAHELGHVALGHSRRRMIDFSGQNALRAILVMTLGRFIPFVGPWIATTLIGLIAARLSRNDEYEADAYAAALLTKAGIGTNGQISLFRKLDALTGASGQPLAWMMSHPKTAERIDAIEKLSNSWK
jgi:putative metalloprotease